MVLLSMLVMSAAISQPANRPRPVPELNSPSCALNPTLPCPLPKWNVEWDLAKSTAIGLYNLSGFYDSEEASKWGLVSFDWNNARDIWLHQNATLDCEECLVEQCRRVKALNPETKCFVYRNTELALSWMASQRAVMTSAHPDYFLQFQSDVNGTAQEKCKRAGPCPSPNGPPIPPPPPGVQPYCCPFGNVYSEDQPGLIAANYSYVHQFFWNFTNADLSEWWINNFILGQHGVLHSPYVDGVFSDDSGGLPQEHEDAIERMGYTVDQTNALHLATANTWQKAMEKLAGKNGYGWQMFGNRWLTALPPDQSNCFDRMNELCQPIKQKSPMMMYGPGGPTWGWNYTEVNTTIAAFLITRPPYGWIGYSVEDAKPCIQGQTSCWTPLFGLQVGEPLELCQQRSPGVFSRRWSKGLVSLDCHQFAATLPFSV